MGYYPTQINVIHPSVRPSVRPSVHPSIHLSIYLSIYLSIWTRVILINIINLDSFYVDFLLVVKENQYNKEL